MNIRNLVRWYLNPFVIGGAIMVALLLIVVTFGAIWLSRPDVTSPRQTTPMLNVLRVPTATPVIPTETPSADLTPTAPGSGSPAGDIFIGAQIEIRGTGGDGLRVRRIPGLAGNIQFVASEGETFIVADGPEEVDGYVWWRLYAVEDESRSGWAVSEFMEVVTAP